MPNTISSTWQFPSGSEYGGPAAQAAAEQYTDMGTAPVAAELGVAPTPIREANPVAETPASPTPEMQTQYYTNTGDAIPTDRSVAVLDAMQRTVNAFDAETETAAQPAPTPEVPQDHNHDRAALERMKFYGPTLETMRDSAVGA